MLNPCYLVHRSFCLLFLLLAVGALQAQVTTFYNYRWEKCDTADARFISVETPTDSGFVVNDYFLNPVRVQMSGRFADDEHKVPVGRLTYYYSDGRTQSTCTYENGKRQGLYLAWHPNGMLADSSYYEDDFMTGQCYRWHSNGVMADSFFRLGAGQGTHATWDRQGRLVSTGRVDEADSRTGKWMLYHPNGKPAAVLLYVEDSVMESSYFGADGSPLSGVEKEVSPEFPGGMAKWRKYLTSKLRWPANVRLENTSLVTVVVDFLIDRDGTVRNVFVSVPFDPRFDDLAVKIISESPPWIPAHQRNIAVPYRQRQAISFQQN